MEKISISLDPSVDNDLESYLEFLNTQPDISIHLDVMDGDFVPRKSVSAQQYAHIVQNSRHKIDVHLMISNPHLKINPYIAKALWGTIRSLSFHPEGMTESEILALMKKIRLMGLRAGIVIDLPVAIDALPSSILDDADMFTVMSVKAGASGQKFQHRALDKVKRLKKLYPNTPIIIDGGINPDNATAAKDAGTTTLVVGNAVYSAGNRTTTIKALQKV